MSDLIGKCVVADAVEFLKTLDDSSVNLILTDPSYESLEKHRKVGTTTRLSNSKSSSNDWFNPFPNSRYPEFFHECWRVLKKGSHMYVFSDDESAYVMKPAAEWQGFKYWKQIIWVKMVNDGSVPVTGMGYHYRGANERILFFEKGKRKLSNLSIRDVLMVPRIHRGYPTEKPVDLLRILIKQSTKKGELVVDPFVGSGSAGVASILEGVRFLGCDISESAQKAAMERMVIAYQSTLDGDQ